MTAAAALPWIPPARPCHRFYYSCTADHQFPHHCRGHPTHPIGSLYSRDAFVTKLNTDGSGLVYSTFLGGTNSYDSGSTYGMGITVDAAGNAYVTGRLMPPVIFPLRRPPSRLPGAVIINTMMPLSPRTTLRLRTTCSPPTWGAAVSTPPPLLRCLTPAGAIVTSMLPAAPVN